MYCQNDTDFQGPLQVTLAAGDSLNFGIDGEKLDLVCRNRLPVPARLHLATFPGVPELPLLRVDQEPNTLIPTYPELPPEFELGELEPQGSRRLSLAIRRQVLTAGHHSAVLCISSDVGARVWVAAAAWNPTPTLRP